MIQFRMLFLSFARENIASLVETLGPRVKNLVINIFLKVKNPGSKTTIFFETQFWSFFILVENQKVDFRTET